MEGMEGGEKGSRSHFLGSSPNKQGHLFTRLSQRLRDKSISALVHYNLKSL